LSRSFGPCPCARRDGRRTRITTATATTPRLPSPAASAAAPLSRAVILSRLILPATGIEPSSLLLLRPAALGIPPLLEFLLLLDLLQAALGHGFLDDLPLALLVLYDVRYAEA
jgi:hypothetical protein